MTTATTRDVLDVATAPRLRVAVQGGDMLTCTGCARSWTGSPTCGSSTSRSPIAPDALARADVVRRRGRLSGPRRRGGAAPRRAPSRRPRRGRRDAAGRHRASFRRAGASGCPAPRRDRLGCRDAAARRVARGPGSCGPVRATARAVRAARRRSADGERPRARCPAAAGGRGRHPGDRPAARLLRAHGEGRVQEPTSRLGLRNARTPWRTRSVTAWSEATSPAGRSRPGTGVRPCGASRDRPGRRRAAAAALRPRRPRQARRAVPRGSGDASTSAVGPSP